MYAYKLALFELLCMYILDWYCNRKLVYGFSETHRISNSI